MTNNDKTPGDELEILRVAKEMEIADSLHHGTDGPRPDFIESAKVCLRELLS